MNQQQKFAQIALVFTSLMASGCGDKAIENVRTAAANEMKAPELTEDWHSQCVRSKILDASMVVEYEFAGDAFVERYRYFTGDQCQKETEAANLRYMGHFSVNTEVTPHQVDMRYDETKIAITSEEGRNVVDKVDFCGREEWAVGEEIDLTQAERGVKCPIKSVSQHRFDIFKVENNTLFLGTGYLESDAENPADRPTEFQTAQPYFES